MELRIPPSVAIGDPIPIELVNVDDHDYAFHHPGASNGCGAFQFEVAFVAGGIRYHQDTSMMGCGQGLVPPRWIVIAKGSSTKFEEETDQPVVAGKASGLGAGKPLAPGKYTLTVTGGGIAVSAPITLTPKKKTP